MRTLLLILFLLAALAAVGAGIVSYRRPLPAEGLWITNLEGGSHLHWALARGTLHLVHSGPRYSFAQADSARRLGPFYVKTVVLGGPSRNALAASGYPPVNGDSDTAAVGQAGSAGTAPPAWIARGIVAWGVGGPIWFVAALLLIDPIMALVRGPLRRHKRRRHGWCLRCGYDLKGLIEPRCPECGTEFDPAGLPAQLPPHMEFPLWGRVRPRRPALARWRRDLLRVCLGLATLSLLGFVASYLRISCPGTPVGWRLAWGDLILYGPTLPSMPYAGPDIVGFVDYTTMWWPSLRRGASWAVYVPLWMPATGSLLAAVVLWYRRRPRTVQVQVRLHTESPCVLGVNP